MTSNPELSYGERGAWVTYLQTLLNHHYQQTVVAETGEFDEATAGVVEYFRQQNGMPRGSTADSAVWSTLEAAEPAASEQREPRQPDANHTVHRTAIRHDRGVLDDEGNIAAFIDAAYGATVECLTADDRKDQLLQFVNDILQSGGVPPINGVFGSYPDDADASGAFHVRDWQMVLNERRFHLEIHAADTPYEDARRAQDQYRRLLGTIYHEARHAEQIFRAAQERAGLGATAPNITSAMTAHADGIVPPSYIVDLAVLQPITECDETQFQAEEWYANLYGVGARHRDAVLTNFRADPTNTLSREHYLQQPEEADAYAVHEAALGRYRRRADGD